MMTEIKEVPRESVDMHSSFPSMYASSQSAKKDAPVKQMYKVKNPRKIKDCDIARRYFKTQQKSRQRTEIHKIEGSYEITPADNVNFVKVEKEDGKSVISKKTGTF